MQGEVRFEGTNAIIGRWLVKEGDVVTEGKVLLRYSSSTSGASDQLVSKFTGVVGKVMRQEGEKVCTGDRLCKIKPCPHDESFNGICTTCGEMVGGDEDAPPRGSAGQGGNEGGTHGEERKSFGFFGGVACTALRRSEKGVKKQQQQRVQEMVAARKLALVLDLDHTLLHTTWPPSESQKQAVMRVESVSKDVRQLRVKDMVYFTKLRPHVRDFLEKLSHLYELYIYTAGDRDYAEAIAEVLDEHKKYFPGRIISRDDYGDVAKEKKGLDKVFPLAQHWTMVLILDDNNETWDVPQSDGRNSINNLIHCHKYSFWPRHLGETHNPVVLGGHPSADAVACVPQAPAPQGATVKEGECADGSANILAQGASERKVADNAAGKEAHATSGVAGTSSKAKEVQGEEPGDAAAEWMEGEDKASSEADDDEGGGRGSGDEDEDAAIDSEMKQVLRKDGKDDYLRRLTQAHLSLYLPISKPTDRWIDLPAEADSIKFI